MEERAGTESRSARGTENLSLGLATCGQPRLALIELAPQERWAVIAVAAYFRAEKRGFAPGGELQDWLDAEREIFS